MRFTEKDMTGFNGGGFDSEWVLNCDVGPTYKRIILRTNLAISQIAQVVLKLNSETIVDLSGPQLEMLQKYKKKHVEDGVIVIPFCDFTQKLIGGQNLTELVTMETDNLTLRVKTGAATAGQLDAALVPTISGKAILGPAREKRTVLPKLYSSLIQVGTTGKNVYKNFERGPRILRMHLNGQVARLEIERDSVKRFEADLVDNNFQLVDFGFEPQDGYFHFDPIKTGFATDDALVTAGRSFEINPFVASADDVPTIFEVIERVAA